MHHCKSCGYFWKKSGADKCINCGEKYSLGKDEEIISINETKKLCEFKKENCFGPGPLACNSCKGKTWKLITYVNTAEHSKVGGGFRRAKSGDSNCSIVSCAGALNLILGNSFWDTDMICKELKIENTSTGLGKSRDEHCESIKTFVQKFTKRSVTQFGTEDKGLDISTAFNKMKEFPVGTVFAIAFSGKSISGKIFHHWINAKISKKYGECIKFYDFQSNRHIKNNILGMQNQEPLWSYLPFCGVDYQLNIIEQHENEQFKEERYNYIEFKNSKFDRLINMKDQKANIINTYEISAWDLCSVRHFTKEGCVILAFFDSDKLEKKKKEKKTGIFGNL